MSEEPLDRAGVGPSPWLSVCQPKNFLRPCLLLLLDECAAYGYELRERLRPFQCGTWDHGTVYRFLNTMEAEGLVTSRWERSPSGPQRRRYVLTANGREVLADWAKSVESISDVLLSFTVRYRQSVEKHAGAVQCEDEKRATPLDVATTA